MIWQAFREWRQNRILRRHALPTDAWEFNIAALPLMKGLSTDELGRLRELVTLFLYQKDVTAAAGHHLQDDVRLKIAVQACLPILNLGLDYYVGWVTVIVYPNEFVPEHRYTDDAGVVHVTRDIMIGESWERGPVILSAADALRSGSLDGVNVVIHEFAHKLDMLNGQADGYPPLHRGMSSAAWAQVFSRAYEDFCSSVQAGIETGIDPYAAENPAEFFAVLSEVFFETPKVLLEQYPEVYEQLAGFYRQDPALRLG
jgi:Mlc titration factor MtfA (ptsG expression regulator)